MQETPAGIAQHTLIHERYLVTRTIGRGGMGAVYEAVDQRLGNTVALKQMLVGGANLSAAFEREARILAGLRHPSLPRVTDYFSDALGQFLVMEFIPGTDLGSLLAQRGRPFPVEEVLGWANQILGVLEYLHVQQPPIIHRDIKPQNIKLTPAGEIVLLDFGLAKNAASALGTTGSIFAYTPTYAPLEQVQGTGTGAASDIYSLAATLYHLLTGVPPADVLQRVGARASGQADPLRPAHELNPLVPPAVGLWLQGGLELEAARRPPAAAAMRAELGRLQRGLAPAATGTTLLAEAAATAPSPVPLPPVGPQAAQQAAPQRRNGLMIVLLGLVALLLLGAGAGFVLLRGAGQAQTSAQATGAPVPTEAAAPTVAALPTEAAAPSAAASATPEPPQATLAPIVAQASAISPLFGPLGPQQPRRVTASGVADPSVDSAGATTTFDAANLADGRPDTAWRVAGDGRGQSVQLDFAGPVRVSEVQLIPGYAKLDAIDGTNRFNQNRRVRAVRLEFSDGSSFTATFADLPTLQAVALPQPVVSSYLRIVILETTDPGAQNGRDFTPISEIVVIGEAQL
jgi:hypothetical protein